MAPWQEILGRIVPRLAPALEDPQTRWALIGSAATALQGCPVTPRDLDFLTQHPQGVRGFVARLAEFMPDTCPHRIEDPDWISSAAHPISHGPDEYGYTWHFARWKIHGLKVEAAHIAPPKGFRTSEDGNGIWEAGPEIWPHIVTTVAGSLRVPVVPLELQLGTNMQRGLDDRVRAIIGLLRKRGHDAELLQRALTADQRARFCVLASASADCVPSP